MSAECRKIAGSFPQPTYDGPLCSCQGGCALEIDSVMPPFENRNDDVVDLQGVGDVDDGGQVPYDTSEETTFESDALGGFAPGTTYEEAKAMRQFETGATRNKEVDPDIYGFTSPLALGAFAEYMHKNRMQADGTLRDSDNWKKGIPLDSYIRSMRRHMQDLTLIHDGYDELAREDLLDALGGLFFNVQGYMHEAIKQGLEMGPTLEEKILDVLAALDGQPGAIIIETGVDFTDEGTEEKTDA